MSKARVVGDLMSSDLHTVERNDELRAAEDLMTTGRFRHLPVLDEEGALAGIVSQRDLFRSALARALGYGEAAQDRLLGMLKVKDVMSHPVLTASVDEPIAVAAQRMVDAGVGCLVVVESDRVIGILTEGDFVRHAAG